MTAIIGLNIPVDFGFPFLAHEGRQLCRLIFFVAELFVAEVSRLLPQLLRTFLVVSFVLLLKLRFEAEIKIISKFISFY